MASIMSMCVKKGCKKLINGLINRIHLGDFVGHMFRKWVQSTKNFQDKERRGQDYLLLEKIFERLQINFKDLSHIRVHVPLIYCKKILEVLRKKIALTGKQDAFNLFKVM